MPKKKSGKKAARTFRKNADEIVGFAHAVRAAGLSAQQVSWAFDLAIIRLYREFENLMLTSLVAAINNDTGTISATVGLDFPKHLSDEVCEYLIVGTGYFDFKGRDGLIREIRRVVPEPHYLNTIIKKQQYRVTLERLIALRNFAAHGSRAARKNAMTTINVRRLATSGAWLKGEDRLKAIANTLKALADEIENAAPY